MAVLSESETRRFIELVKSYPCIWDCSNPHYIDRSLASECFVSISKAMGNGMTERGRIGHHVRRDLSLPVMNLLEKQRYIRGSYLPANVVPGPLFFADEDAKKKLKSLRTQFRYKVKHMTENPSSGISKWKYFKPLEFLLPYTTGTRDETVGRQFSFIPHRRPEQNYYCPAARPEEDDSSRTENGTERDTDRLDPQETKRDADHLIPQEFKPDTDHLDLQETKRETDHCDPQEAMSKTSDAGSFKDDSDVSMSLSLSVDEDNVGGVQDEDVHDRVWNVQRPVPRMKNQTFKQNLSESHYMQQDIQNSRIRSSNDISLMGSSVCMQRRKLCKSKRRRKNESTVSAARMLKGLTNKLLKREPESSAMTENDHFFRMMAIEVSRLPASAQDSLRYKIHRLLMEEKKKFSE